MKPFDPKATCPKCGGIAVDAQYLPPYRAFMADPAKPERIERRCQRCRYAWHEAPLDSVKAETSASGGRVTVDRETAVREFGDNAREGMLDIDCA